MIQMRTSHRYSYSIILLYTCVHVHMKPLPPQVLPAADDGGQLRGVGAGGGGGAARRAGRAAHHQRGARRRRQPARRAPPAPGAAGHLRLDRRGVVSGYVLHTYVMLANCQLGNKKSLYNKVVRI